MSCVFDDAFGSDADFEESELADFNAREQALALAKARKAKEDAEKLLKEIVARLRADDKKHYKPNELAEGLLLKQLGEEAYKKRKRKEANAYERKLVERATKDINAKKREKLLEHHVKEAARRGFMKEREVFCNEQLLGKATLDIEPIFEYLQKEMKNGVKAADLNYDPADLELGQHFNTFNTKNVQFMQFRSLAVGNKRDAPPEFKAAHEFLQVGARYPIPRSWLKSTSASKGKVTTR